MMIILRDIPGDPVVIWEQNLGDEWARFVVDFVDNTLDVASFRNGQWCHLHTIHLMGV